MKKKNVNQRGQENTQSADYPPIRKRYLISFFVVFNIFIVLYMNRPPELITWGTHAITTRLGDRKAYYSFYCSWLIKRYAHLSGLDNRWEMFGRQSRFNWEFIIKGQYGDSKPIVLPLPLQSKRTFLQKHFFDFREVKFHLNLYPSSRARGSYSSFLARQFSERNGVPIRKIIWELHHQNIFPRKEASATGKHLEEAVYSRIIDEFEIN